LYSKIQVNDQYIISMIKGHLMIINAFMIIMMIIMLFHQQKLRC